MVSLGSLLVGVEQDKSACRRVPDPSSLCPETCLCPGVLPGLHARAACQSLDQRLRASQIDRWRIELSDERGRVGCELRSLFHVPIHAMAVVAHARPVKDCSATLGIACRLCALG